jgi:L-threonylcarbamoyladenylate synthase
LKILRGDDPENLRTIADMIIAGQAVVLPTETVYGLAADALNPKAVRSIFKIKQRPSHDPLIVHLAEIEQVDDIAFAPPILKDLAAAFWPGPLTVVLKKKAIVPDIVTSGLPTVGIRIPAHPLFRKILKAVDRPLAAPSANPFGYVSPTQAEHVTDSFDTSCPMVLDGGPTDHGIESTILSLADPESPVILRSGPLSAKDLTTILGVPLSIRSLVDNSRPLAPGSMKRHYSPKVSLKLHPDTASIQREIQTCQNHRQTGVLLLRRALANDSWPLEIKVSWLSETGSLQEVAQKLYDSLRKMDSDPLLKIVHCETPENQGIGTAINDRLLRAASQD